MSALTLNQTRQSSAIPQGEQGFVLVVALILLLILTLLGLASIQSTSLEEKMAGNQRQQALAFQAAEAALRQGESSLVGSASLPPFNGGVLGYYNYPIDPSTGSAMMAGSDWQTWNWSNAIGISSNQLGSGGNSGATAQYYIEPFIYVPTSGQSLDASAPIPGQQIYAITARGVSPDGKAIVILQSTYKR